MSGLMSGPRATPQPRFASQAGVGGDPHGWVVAESAPALLSYDRLGVSRQRLPFRRHEGPAVFHGVAK